MSEHRPRVSIGLPVYNGESLVEESIESLLGQTYEDFELIVSDNASTDRTDEICRGFAARDDRIKYVRNAENLGATKNFNRVFELARGDYFKWAAHDDMHDARYVEKCVEVLDRETDVVLAYGRARDIDKNGHPLRDKSYGLKTDSPRPEDRFRDLIRNDYTLESIFGLMRAAVLRRTPLMAYYADCDRVLLAEIGLNGRFCEIPEYLYLHREHEKRSVRQFKSRQTRSAFLDPGKAGKPVFPCTKQLFGYLAAIRRAPLSSQERWRCYGLMARWIGANGGGLLEDYTYAGRHVLRPLKHRFLSMRNDHKR